MTDSLQGVIAAVPTPVGPDRRIDVDRFLGHARWALERGCDALNVLGSTGEATSLAATERARLMQAAAAALPRGRLMVGTGAPDIETAIALTAHAGACGFAAALVLPPYYYKSVGTAELFAWFSALVEATADRPIALHLYNFPQMTGLRFAPELVSRLTAAHPGRICGIKDSSGDLAYAASLTGHPGFKVFPSDETALAEAADRGFAGCISATVNLSAPLAARLWQSPGDEELRVRVAEFRAALAGPGLIPAVKALVARLHDDPGHAAPRPPLLPPDGPEAARLQTLPLPV